MKLWVRIPILTARSSVRIGILTHKASGFSWKKSMSYSSHCRQFVPAPLTRREMLLGCANGFGAVALAALLAEEEASAKPQALVNHHPARARNIIFLYMDGGP